MRKRKNHSEKILKVNKIVKRIEGDNLSKKQLFRLGRKNNHPLLWESIVSNLEKRNMTLTQKEIDNLCEKKLFPSTKFRLEKTLSK